MVESVEISFRRRFGGYGSKPSSTACWTKLHSSSSSPLLSSIFRSGPEGFSMGLPSDSVVSECEST